MKKAINKMAEGGLLSLPAQTTQTGIQSPVNRHGKTPCKNLTSTGYCTVCKRQCPAATINSSLNQ